MFTFLILLFLLLLLLTSSISSGCGLVMIPVPVLPELDFLMKKAELMVDVQEFRGLPDISPASIGLESLEIRNKKFIHRRTFLVYGFYDSKK